MHPWQMFGAARMAVGGVSWLSPRLSARIFGADPDAADPIIMQLFGARDFAIGLLTAVAGPEQRAQVLRIGVAIDAVDTVAGARQLRAGTLTTRGKILTFGGAASFAAIGAALLAAGDDPA